jgi:pimeloyl-ACP methyl ester carboxylesterase
LRLPPPLPDHGVRRRLTRSLLSLARACAQAEDFFLDPLIAFFDLKRITKASLIGHSLGGYLVAAFALRYPARARSLMLLSPAGIPTHPAPTTATPPPTPTSQSRRPSQPSDGESTTTTTTTAPTSTAQSPGEGNSRGGVDGRRLQQALIRSVSHDVAGAGGIGGSSGGGSSPERRHGSAADSWDSPGAADKFEAAVQAGTVPDEDGVVHDDPLTDGDDDDDDDDRKPQTFKGPLGNGKRMQALYSYMWEAGYSPLGFLRKAGPIGPLMLGKYSTARFGGLAPDEQTALNAYLSNITLLPGSGEYAVGILLRPGAFARFPIAERIHALGKDVPCQFVYGSEDWMDRHGGKDCLRALRKVGNRTSEVAITPEAGHQCVLLLPPRPSFPPVVSPTFRSVRSTRRSKPSTRLTPQAPLLPSSLYIDNAAWMNDYLKRTLIPLSSSNDGLSRPPPLVSSRGSSGGRATSDDGQQPPPPSPPPTPASSSFPTAASTALNTPRASVSHSPETAKAELGRILA